MKQIYVIHENNAWVEPLRTAFGHLGLPFTEWFLDSGTIDLDAEPPNGVFYNRMSASSHTRGHRWGPEYTAAVLAWLERHHRRVVNNSQALRLEISKVAQYAALNDAGVRTPRTVAAVGRDEILRASQLFDLPFITKHNRAGKGLGVRLFRDREALKWLIGLDLPMIVAATKMDRLKRSQRLKVVKQHETALGTDVLPISAPKGDGLGPFWMALLGLAGL